jgi:hypothetical protein
MSRTLNHYVYQHPLYGIGNFIQSTPAIQMLANIHGPVPIYFENQHLKSLYQDWEALQILDAKPKTAKKLLCTSWVNYEIPDWRYQAEIISNKAEVPHTYVPLCEEYPVGVQGEYVVIIRGMKGKDWAHLKDPGDSIYRWIMKQVGPHYTIVFIGTDEDFHRDYNRMISWGNTRIVSIKNDIKRSVSALQGAAFVITNDTGFYHVSGALKKKTFCLWKKTNWIKNNSPNPNEMVSFRWKSDFIKWFKLQRSGL